nr:AEL_HP1_G0006500.mRNA.1.CDS.1 [Saccharomyces cerevisiae]
MNVLQFLGFRSDEIKHLFSMVLTYTSARRCSPNNTDYARAVKMFELCVCWAGQKVSYRRISLGSTSCGERMLRNRNTKNARRHPGHIIPQGPCRVLKYFSVKREIYSQIQRNYAWYLAITRRETISVLVRQRGKQGAKFSASGRQIKELCITQSMEPNLRESKTEVLQYFLNWDEKVPGKNGRQKTIRSLTGSARSWVFSVCVPDERWTAGSTQCDDCSLLGHHRQLRSRYGLEI